jgi:hypothetical protein
MARRSIPRAQVVAFVLRTIAQRTGIPLDERTRFATVGLTAAARRDLAAPLRRAAAAKGWPTTMLTAARCGAAKTPADIVDVILRDLSAEQPKARKKTSAPRTKSRAKKAARKTGKTATPKRKGSAAKKAVRRRSAPGLPAPGYALRSHAHVGVGGSGGGARKMAKRSSAPPRKAAAPKKRKIKKGVLDAFPERIGTADPYVLRPGVKYSGVYVPKMPPRQGIMPREETAPLEDHASSEEMARNETGAPGAEESLRKTANGGPKRAKPPAREEEAPQPPAPTAALESERRISIWIGERNTARKESLKVGETYLLNFKVGTPVEETLVSGDDTVVPSADVSEQGLATEWVVTSQQVELAAGSAETSADSRDIDGKQTWTARFVLLIPPSGESAIPQLRITPRERAATLDVLLYARVERKYGEALRSEIYRQFHIELDVVQAGVSEPPLAPVSVTDDLVHTPAAHLGLKTPHEWMTPPGETTIIVVGQLATVKGDEGKDSIDDIVFWRAVQAGVSGPITNVRNSAERFRAAWESYLNDIDPADLPRRLQEWPPGVPDPWHARARADAGHLQKWQEVATSNELRDLAYDGHALYEAFFPADSDSELRTWIDARQLGHRLDISWNEKSGPGWVAGVPWGLMYLPDLPPAGQPIDPMGFLGLRFRIGYTAHPVQALSKALGAPSATYRANFLYWGDTDTTGREARRQQQQWAAQANQVFVPAAQSANRKAELLQFLANPAPAPMAVLYLFCQCKVGQGNDPALGFGAEVADIVRRTELATTLLADRPFIFANACTTASSDPYIANELEQGFFRRGCRAFLGTETKVPIEFASRFASIFFHFFYRLLDPQPMAAGEAVAQTRLFLWTHYRNIGGLFYTYVNQYELFMADDAEVVALRAA